MVVVVVVVIRSSFLPRRRAILAARARVANGFGKQCDRQYSNDDNRR